MQNILFRADSSSKIGTGHIMRDLVLAEQYPDAEISFAVQDLNGNINHKIQEKGYKVIILKSNDVDELVEVIQAHEIDMIVIDHYEIDWQFEKTIKNRTHITLLVFDDTYEKHYCDILLNHNVYGEEARYKGLVPNDCELRCGSEFTLLRKEFTGAKKIVSSLIPQKVLIAMGGADTANLNVKILKVLEEFQGIHVDIVTTTANQHLDELKKYMIHHHNMTLHMNTNGMAKLMSESDFAIVTPSVVVNEVIAIGLSFISIKTADNQIEMYNYLTRSNYLSLPLFNTMQLKMSITQLMKSLTIHLKNFVTLPLKEKEEVLMWRNHEGIRKWMFSDSSISLVDHIKYIESLNNKEDRVYFLVKQGENSIGVVDLTNIDMKKVTANLGIYANPNVRGMGKFLMMAILNYGFKQLNLKSIISEVFADNKAAIKLYEKFEFKEIGTFICNGRNVLRLELLR